VVVRLKDLDSKENKKTGLVRLSDLDPKKKEVDVKPTLKPFNDVSNSIKSGIKRSEVAPIGNSTLKNVSRGAETIANKFPAETPKNTGKVTAKSFVQGLLKSSVKEPFQMLDYVGAKIAEKSAPTAPYLGGVTDKYGNANPRQRTIQMAKESGLDTSGSKTLDRYGDTIGVIGAMLSNPSRGPNVANVQDIGAIQRLSTLAGMEAGNLVPKALAPLTSRIASGIGRELPTGAIQGASYGLMTGDGSVKDIAKETAWGTLGGAAAGGLGGAFSTGIRKLAGTKVGAAFENFMSRSQAIPEELETAARQAIDTADNPTGRTLLKDLVTERMTPPLENPNELAKWLQPHLGESLNEIRKLSYDDMAELAADVRANLKTYDVAEQVARERGVSVDDVLGNRVDPIPSPTVPEPSMGTIAPDPTFAMQETPQTMQRGFVNTVQQSENASPQLQKGISANYKNQLDNGNFSPELQQSIRNTDQSYDIKTNKATVEAANAAVNNLPEAEARFLNNTSGGAEHIATGYRLMQKLDASGEHERALTIARKLASDLTESGQTVQAASILSRLSPEGQLLNLIKVAEQNGKVVSTADSIKFKALAEQVQKNSGSGIRANQFNEILNRIEKGEDVSVADFKKLSDYLSGAESLAKSKKTPKLSDDLPVEFKDARKRDKIVSFLDDAEQAALARIAARKNRLNAFPIDEWADHAIVVSAQIAKGVIKASTHVEDLVKMFGEEIRPVATEVFRKAQGLVKSVSGGISENDITKASQSLRRLSGEAAKEKAIVVETANHVKKLIADSKAGNLDPADIQKLRDYADEVADMLEGKPKREISQEQRFLQSVKSLSKKIAQADEQSIPKDQANREISSLLRTITKISDEGTQKLKVEPLDTNALNNIAYDVMEKTKPNPKPTTLQEKIVEKYLKQQEKEGVTVKPEDIDNLRQLAKNINRLSGDSKVEADIAMQKILNSYEKSSVWDKSQAIRYMGMLLNTGTQLVNAASGPIMSATGYAADIFGTMLDTGISKALKTPRTTTLYGSNPLKYIARYMKGLKTGGKAGALGVNPAGIQSTNEIRGLAFKSPKNPVSLLERGLGAVSKGPDYATYSAVYKSEIEKQGYLDAINKGIKRSDRQAIRSHIENFVNDPPESAMLQADRIGKNTTFQRSDSTGGKIANYLNSGPPAVKPVVNAVFPFVRTPINMASSAVTLTPAGIIKGLFQLTSKSKASQREAIRTLSLGITGSGGIGVLGYYLSDLGIITGANDSGDKDVDAIREQAGLGKYRFNTSGMQRYLSALLEGEGDEAAERAAKYREGDKTFDYNKLQPLAFPFAIGASLGKNKQRTPLTRATSAAVDAYGSLYGMSTLKGVQDVFQPSYGGTVGEKALGAPSRIAESFFKSFSPSALAQEARRQDPIVRKTPYNDGIVNDVLGYYKSRTPILSKTLPANKTTLGLDKRNAPGFMGQYVNPYRSEVSAYSEAAVIITELIDKTGDTSIAPSAPQKKVTGKKRGTNESVTIAIEPDRYEQLQEELGQAIISKILSLPPGLSDEKKVDRIKKIYSDAREKEMNKIKKELGIKTN
jgi:hypothetical protein